MLGNLSRENLLFLLNNNNVQATHSLTAVESERLRYCYNLEGLY